MYTDNMIPIRRGNYNLTSGAYSAAGFICQEDGVLTIVDSDNGSNTLSLEAGQSVMFFSEDTKSITITSGKFIKA